MRRLSLSSLFALLALSPLLVEAQAPRITAKGDPSVRNDTIYALAVKKEDHPDEDWVYLLDDGVLRYDADGRGTSTFRQVVQILTADAVESWAEQSFSYAPDRERLTVNWIRVVKPNGDIISAKPTIEQTSDVPAAMSSPVYQERKVLRMSLTGVAPGTIVDYSYTRERIKPYLEGDFYETWGVTTGRPTRRSRYVVDLPESLTPRIRERNLSFPRITQTVKGRRIYTWATKDVPRPPRAEPFSADSNDIYMSVAIAAPMQWSRIGGWYAGLAKDRYTLTPEIRRTLDTVVAKAKSADDSLRAVHRWVAQDFRYVSVSLGIGGYQPRAPAKMFETGFGDCKDKATLFVASARALGRAAYPVLLSSGGGVDTTMPSIDQFDHAIAAVRDGAGKYTYFDLTSELTPYGSIPSAFQGEFGIVVHDDGVTEEIRFPLDSVGANYSETRIAGALSAEGKFNGRYLERGIGSAQYGLREAFATPLDSTQRANVSRSIAQSMFRGAAGDSLIGFEGKNLTAEPKVSLVIKNGQATRRSGATEILTLPLGGLGAWAEARVNLLDEKPERHYPIGAALPPMSSYREFRVTLPEGWTARLPDDVVVKGIFGSYESRYRQEGRDLVVTRHITGTRDLWLPKERVGELKEWLRAVAKDEVPFLVLDRK